MNDERHGQGKYVRRDGSVNGRDMVRGRRRRHGDIQRLGSGRGGVGHHEFGDGVTQSSKEARRLYAKALKLGLTEASEDLKRIEDKIRAAHGLEFDGSADDALTED